MERKFLAFSCLVLLGSIVYFIYTSYQLHIENKNQQEVTVELEVPAVERVYTNNSSQSVKPESPNLDPTEEKREVFEEALKNLEALEEEAKTEAMTGIATSETGASETEIKDIGISPELEALFVGVKQFMDQEKFIDSEVRSYLDENFKLKQRQIEIITNDLLEAQGEESGRLHEEFQRNIEHMETLSDIIIPFGKQMIQLRIEFEQKHGITLEEFMENHGEDFHSWKALQ